jgi:hypothetical protein
VVHDHLEGNYSSASMSLLRMSASIMSDSVASSRLYHWFLYANEATELSTATNLRKLYFIGPISQQVGE